MYLDFISNIGFLEARAGSHFAFHDSEILSILIDYSSPSIMFAIAIPFLDLHVKLIFEDIENLELHDFQHQNVIWSLRISEITEERFLTGNMEKRGRVEIDSVFGARCCFSTSRGSISEVG